MVMTLFILSFPLLIKKIDKRKKIKKKTVLILGFQTPSHVESTDDEDSDEEIKGANVEGDKLDEEETNEEVEANELYRNVNVNLSSSVSSGFISNMLNPSPDTSIDSLFNLNTESTSLVDVPVTTIAEPPLFSATTLPPPPTPLITHLQQTPVPTPANVPRSSLQDLPNFSSLFGFDHRLKTLETDFFELKQTKWRKGWAKSFQLLMKKIDKRKKIKKKTVLILGFQTPSHVESTDDEDSDEEIKGANIEGDKPDEEETNEEVEANELYRNVNVNLSSSVSSGFISNMLNPSPDTSIDSLFNLNTESTSLVDVPVTTIAEPPLFSATTLPPPPTPLITHLQQTPVPTSANVPSPSLQDLPNFGSLFGLRDEAQAKNADFINKLDDNIKKIIKDQVKEQVKAQVSKILPKIEKIVNEQLEAEVLTRSSNESKTSHAVASNLSELKLKNILIDKMESNKSIHRSDEQKNLYKALVDAYESDKLILDTYGDNVSFKRRRDNEDKDEEPSAGSNRGSKR
ncbi:hypothetical protein Tco_0868369 [Tanacetum coccineum]